MKLERLSLAAILIAVTLSGAMAASSSSNKSKAKKAPEPSALDKYIQEALSHGTPAVDQPSAGSLWSPASRLTDLGSDLRAVQVNDLVTVLVDEQASALVSGDVISVRNPESSRTFQARVEGKDRVQVNAMSIGID